MEDGTVANGQVTVEISPQEEESQVEILSKEVTISKSSIAALEVQIEDYTKERVDMTHQIEQLQDQVRALDSVMARASSLEGEVSRLQKERVDMTDQIEQLQDQVRALDSVMARASSLEGEVSRLQHDLVSTMSEGDELRLENCSLAGKVKALEERVAGLGAAVEEKEGRIVELEALVKGLEVEKVRLGEEKEVAVREFEERLERAVKELEKKAEQVDEAQRLAADAIAEVEALQGSMADFKEAGKVREVGAEIGVPAADDEKKKEKGIGETGCLAMLPWAVTAVSAGTVVAAVAVIYLRYSRER